MPREVFNFGVAFFAILSRTPSLPVNKPIIKYSPIIYFELKQMAMDEINENGGVRGDFLKLVLQDRAPLCIE